MVALPMAGNIEKLPRGIAINGARLRELRLEAKLTNRQLAERVGASEESVSLWQRGGRIDRKNLVAVAHALDVPLGELVADGGAPAPPPTEATVEERLSWLEGQVMPWLMRHDRFVRDSFPALAGDISRLDERIEALAGSVADAVRELRQAAAEHQQRAEGRRRRDT